MLVAKIPSCRESADHSRINARNPPRINARNPLGFDPLISVTNYEKPSSE